MKVFDNTSLTVKQRCPTICFLSLDEILALAIQMKDN